MAEVLHSPRDHRMLLLAQVQPQSNIQSIEFQVLARQLHEPHWLISHTPEKLTTQTQSLLTRVSADLKLREGELLLLQVSDQQDITHVESALPFLLNLLRSEGNNTLRPVIDQQEAERAEEWRQRLTLQTQELSRQRVEIEARRIQIQQIEETLKQERQTLERQRLEVQMKLEQLQQLQAQLNPSD